MDLNDISKKDKYWREIAFYLSKDKMIADDIVQEMYLKVFELKKTINDNYIKKIIINLWYDDCRKKKNINIDELFFLNDNECIFEPNDEEFEILLRTENLIKHQKEFLEESYDNSIRKIANIFNKNYGYVFRELKKAKEIVLKK